MVKHYVLKFYFFDPRLYQITTLTLLLLYGILFLHFEINLLQIIVIITTALIVQFTWIKILMPTVFDWRSPLISSLSLCLLLRTHVWLLLLTTVIITISSKFLLRYRDKHIFNPTNFGLAIMIGVSDSVWVSPGQWGNTAFFGFLIACLGGLVINRSERSDVVYAFLLFYINLLVGRALWLGDPLTIPFHQLQNGAFLLFSFFMISDPKTTPNSRLGRILFAFLVAVGAIFVQFVLFRHNGLLWSLVCCCLFVPIIDYYFPAKTYNWH